MVLDWADEAVESMARVIRECPPNESLTAAVVRAMKEDMERFDDVPDDIVMFLPRFVDLIDSTPALRAAWLEMHDRIVTVVTEALAARAEVDPRDPEPMIAARALSGLGGVALAARVRYIEQGLRGIELRDAVLTDLERAARLLDTGLWSFNLLTHGRRTRQQVLDAAKSAEDARQQVVKALRQARTAWRQIREERRDAMRRAAGGQARRDARGQAPALALGVAKSRQHRGRRRRDVRWQAAEQLAPARLERDRRLHLRHAGVEIAGLGGPEPGPEQQLVVAGGAVARLHVQPGGLVVAPGALQLVGAAGERVASSRPRAAGARRAGRDGPRRGATRRSPTARRRGRRRGSPRTGGPADRLPRAPPRRARSADEW